ncbi:myosin-like coiled-coil protein-domain-containing protein [Dendryphion nanum]|uniref:Myosin-like coiled-coil protein-domain-containing protein n=1 Tax=Dendryphion nanum TaxID=256645 RepID=A0A9P9ITP2_9PLEO|nr:myosin-like coiled-coil protein-domain-containing protein [Dendryphion nanum]
MARLEQQRKQQEMESSKSHQLTKQVSTFSQTETELRTQLNIYVEKFKQMQVEETLNNSNDLFLTFRKEMEEMSKKTKRLEKENQNLTRNKEITNRNIGEMVEERQKMQESLSRKDREMEEQRKKIARLETLCRGMQAQGRGQVPMNELEEDEEITESEYDYEDEDEEGSAEYDDDTEEEVLETVQRRPFGPVPPPPPPPQNAANGKVNNPRQTNGQVNGVKR